MICPLINNSMIITVPLILFFFMTVVASTSDHLHYELVRILFLQTHRETDLFATSGVDLFAVSGVDHAQHRQNQFGYSPVYQP